MIVGGGLLWVTALVGLVLVAATASSSVVVVGPDEVASYTVLGEFRGLLDPGMNFVWPFVSDIRRYERRPEFSVTEAANTADGGRVEATVQVELERGDIRRGYETEAIYATDPVAELRTEAGDLLREALRDRDTETALSAHVDIERALAGELRASARDLCHHIESVDTLGIERVERPAAPEQ